MSESKTVDTYIVTTAYHRAAARHSIIDDPYKAVEVAIEHLGGRDAIRKDDMINIGKWLEMTADSRQSLEIVKKNDDSTYINIIPANRVL